MEASGKLENEIEKDLERYSQRINKYWQPDHWIMSQDLYEEVSKALTEGGENMKVYSIIFVDEEEEKIIATEKVAARDRDSALLKVEEPPVELSKLVRELGTVS